ncbi:hypothetical protein PKB_2629 [Pseudomonas knackmussii B13]|uniref:IraD/Gp25-like domain-containing protein n=1 Tax=Pseudomonas knackmussii (strain DSM 6978 / CCUG 54928 / LMG 23759 / B13) TaxID=1301098 RepID=A0A024HGE6_PSEKB|nr:GPW/gp25 family protein [Pseudomonas knackmussii]CDF83976.1 hypothetical protein PKB_2629 [Pseudomonas knackmussii B13]
MSSGIRDIEESLRIIFSTALGERIMNPLFGCALDSSVFEVMNASRIAWLENLIRTAIIYHEARIDADQITVEPDPLAGRLLIAIGYKGARLQFALQLRLPLLPERGLRP